MLYLVVIKETARLENVKRKYEAVLKQVTIPPGAWMFVCCVLSGIGLCDEMITRPEESYRLWRVVVCDHDTSWNEEAIARAVLQSQTNKQTN
jgi:hypothetical protein